MTVRGILLVAAALAVAMPAAAQQQKKIQCWTDKNGQRMCGDNVPSEYAGQKRDVIRNGRVVDEIKAARTPEEIAEDKRQQEAAAEHQRQADYDRALLETYRSAKDIEQMRDERTALIDLRVQAAEKTAADTDKSLENLRSRADALTKDGKPVDDHLAKQIKQFEKAQADNAAAMARNKAEREDVVQKFNKDLERYNQLRGVKAAPAKPAAAASTPAAPASAPAKGTAAPAPAPAPATAAPAPDKPAAPDKKPGG